MTAFLNQLSSVFNTMLDWLGSFTDTILENPALIMMCIALPILNVAVNIFNRLIRL